MTHDEEMKLVRELGELRRQFNLCDKSEENRKRGERIREIRKALDLHSDPRKMATPR